MMLKSPGRKRTVILGTVLAAAMLISSVIPGNNVVNASTTLFSDNFDSGSGNWSTNGGSWSVVTDGGSKQFRQSNTTGVGFAYPSESSYNNWDNYSVEVKMTIKAENTGVTYRRAAISARYNDNNNRYEFAFQPAQNLILIRKKVNGTESNLASKAYTINTNTQYTIKGVVNGNTLELWVNGVKQLTATDNSLQKGKIALNTYGLSAQYDDVVVKTLDDGYVTIINDQIRRTVDGEEIQAECGCIIEYNGKYWWFGRNGNNNKQVNCYSSTDMVNWVFESVALQVPSGNACRPYVFINHQNNNFVMIVGLAAGTRPQLTFYTSNSIKGPYTWVNQIAQPDGWPMGDLGGFQEGNNAYALFNSDANGVANSRFVIAKLNSSFTDIESIIYRSDYKVNKHEAYSIIKHTDGYYYAFSSMTAGWEPSKTMWKRATTLSGFPKTGGLNGDGWQNLEGSVENKSGLSQHDFILGFTGTSGTAYMFCGDRWPNHSSTYDPEKGKEVWYPLTIENGVPTLIVDNNWKLNIEAGTWMP